MNQAELRLLAQERILDAKALLDGQRWAFAYYTSGYAVECALKSCLLARMIHTGWVFEEKWKAQACLTHDFEELIVLAGLKAELDFQRGANRKFASYWDTAIQWNVAARYNQNSQTEAEALHAAIVHDPDGVMKWLTKYW